MNTLFQELMNDDTIDRGARAALSARDLNEGSDLKLIIVDQIQEEVALAGEHLSDDEIIAVQAAYLDRCQALSLPDDETES